MEERYNYELIKDYLDGTLESNARKAVEKLLREDEVARAIARGILLLDEHFEQDEEKIENYLNSLQAKQNEKINAKLAPGKRSAFLKIAASVALLIVASISIYKYTAPDLEKYLNDQLAETYQAPSVTRSGEETRDDYLRGLTYYRDGAYREAWSILSRSDRPVSIFYSGLCKLYLQEYADAIQILDKEPLQQSIFAQHSKWYLSLAYLKTNQEGKAALLLDELSESEGFKSEEARRLRGLMKPSQ